MSDRDDAALEPRVAPRLSLATALAVAGGLLHQIAVYAPALELRAGPDSPTLPVLEFTDGIRALLPHLAVTLLALVGALVLLRRRELGTGLILAAGVSALVTFWIAVRNTWWSSDVGDLPLHAAFGSYLGLAAALLLLVAGIVPLRGVLEAGRGLPAIATAAFLLGAWLLPWLLWMGVEGVPSDLDTGPLVWLGRALVATAFVAILVAAWTRSVTGLLATALLALVLLVWGLIAGWSLVRILHAATWGAVGTALALYVVAVAGALPHPSLPAALGLGAMGLLLGAVLLPVLTTPSGETIRPIPLQAAPLPALLPQAVREIPPIVLAALGVILVRVPGLSAGLLIGAAVAASPWALLYPLDSVEIGMWLRIAGLLLAVAAVWILLAATSERPGSEPPSPR